MPSALGEALANNLQNKANDWDFSDGAGTCVVRKGPDVVLDVSDGRYVLVYPIVKKLADPEDTALLESALAAVDVPVDNEKEQQLIADLSS